MKKLDKIVALGMLIGAIVFNLWLYRLEPTATIDPNDNAFQFALVDRTNQIWDFAQQSCATKKGKRQTEKGSPTQRIFRPVSHFTFCLYQFTFLFDHWVPNWAEGYNLPFYYSHVPQIFIVASYRLFSALTNFTRPPLAVLQGVALQKSLQQGISLFQYYHWFIYLFLSLFPLSVFLALRVIKLPWLVAGIGALLATHISTDGFYGLDPSSFLWRGYGLTSQLFAMIWLPLAIAYSYRFISLAHREEEGKQFLRELAFRLIYFWKKPLVAKRHLARTRHALYDLDESSRASRKNSFADSFFPAVFFLTATAMGHLGLGLIAMISLVPLALAEPILLILQKQSISSVFLIGKENFIRLTILALTTLFFLSYWIVPIVLNDNYHNFSFWDPIWKFNSYGWKEVLTRFLNGNLFDFGRFPWITVTILIGVFASFWPQKHSEHSADQNIRNSDSPNFASIPIMPYFPFALLFIFWLLLYFGRTTWGNLLDLIPGVKEFHQSRFIVGVHIAGLFLAPIGIQWIAQQIVSRCQRVSISTYVRIKIPFIIGLLSRGARSRFAGAYSLIGLFLILQVYPQTIRYNQLNETLIKQANVNHAKVKADEKELFLTLRSLPPGRVFTGRGGWWGKDFKVAETPYYMHLSTYGIPTVLWLPETWSPNSDIEQYFSEDIARDYDLYNMRYVVSPPNLTHGQKPQPFWKLLKQTATWKLYEVPTSGYFTTGVRAAAVSTKKTMYGNVVRLWIQSDAHEKKLYPELTFETDYPKPNGLPNFRMTDEVTYVIPDNSRHNVFAQPPAYYPPNWEKLNYDPHATPSANLSYLPMKILGPEKVDSDMIFTTKVEVGKNCVECLMILKQSFHPNWRATIDGNSIKPFTVFPFYIAVPVPAGTHDIIFSYEPSRLKILLLVTELFVILLLLGRKYLTDKWKNKII